MPADAYPDQLARRLQDPARLSAVTAALGLVPWHQQARTIAELARQMLRTEIAEVNLVSDTTMHCIASAGGAEREVAVGLSFCQHAVGTGRSVVVYESTTHPLVADSPAAQRLHCYLGIPLTVDGQVLGALCVAGEEPREWTELEISLLTELAETLLEEGLTDLRASA